MGKDLYIIVKTDDGRVFHGTQIPKLERGHATMLLELGENLKVVSERLGHRSVAMTGDIYIHVQEKIQKGAYNKFGPGITYIKEVFF